MGANGTSSLPAPLGNKDHRVACRALLGPWGKPTRPIVGGARPGAAGGGVEAAACMCRFRKGTCSPRPADTSTAAGLSILWMQDTQHPARATRARLPSCFRRPRGTGIPLSQSARPQIENETDHRDRRQGVEAGPSPVKGRLCPGICSGQFPVVCWSPRSATERRRVGARHYFTAFVAVRRDGPARHAVNGSSRACSRATATQTWRTARIPDVGEAGRGTVFLIDGTGVWLTTEAAVAAGRDCSRRLSP